MASASGQPHLAGVVVVVDEDDVDGADVSPGVLEVVVVVVVELGSFGASPPPQATPARAPATARTVRIATFFICLSSSIIPNNERARF